MKKSLITSLLAGGVLVVGLGSWATAGPQIPPKTPVKVTRIVCDGLIGGGSGGNTPCGSRLYAYNVKPGGPITKVEIGTEDPVVSDYQNLCMPAGWSLQIVPIQRRHDIPFTPHGLFTGSSGKCNFLMRFSGPAMTTKFTLSFDLNWDPHDVNWKTDDGSRAAWSFPVGKGPGPVHGPAFP